MFTHIKQGGFSLIELAIVLVIVALLSGGLMMTLSAQKDGMATSETQSRLREAQAMRMVTDAASLARALCELFDDADVRQALAQHAAQLLQEGRGALARTLTLIAPKLPPAAGI